MEFFFPQSIWRWQWQPTPVLLPGKSHGQRSLGGCSPWGCQELDTTEWLHFHFSLSCTGEGNGNPLQYSYLKNPRDRGAWWAAINGVAQSQTWLKQLSSSSSMSLDNCVMTCIHHYDIILNNLTLLKILCVSFICETSCVLSFKSSEYFLIVLFISIL